MEKGAILIVDDNKNILRAITLFLQNEFTRITSLNKPSEIPSALRIHKPDIVLLDMNFTPGASNGNEGFFWLNEIKKTDKSIEVVMLTAYGDVELAVKALKEGACDFVLKPWDNHKLLATLHSALKIRHSNIKLNRLSEKEKDLKREMNKNKTVLLGESKAMQEIKNLIQKVAKTDANILITGENGTGKEVVAREIHKQSLRSDELMVTIDMGSIPENLVESELFGHKKGAFTDAHHDRTGKFQLAHGGVLFLDEIGNIPTHIQSKLLVALQNRTVRPIGSDTEQPVDIRLISATNSDLNRLIAEDRFREDLFYRINTIQIELPPLRERIEDIVLLSDFFLKKFAKKYQKQDCKISHRAIKTLQKHVWHGNIRELEHSIEKAVILNDGKTIESDDFDFKTRKKNIISNTATIEEMEKQLIADTIRTNGGNYTLAAKQLGITRQTLYNKLKKYDF